MKKYTALVVGVGAVLVTGALAACSNTTDQASRTTSTTTSSVVEMPASATFIADMPETMTMAVTVEADKVVAYATNGVDEEAYFFGDQRNGHLDLMSMYGDTMTASFDGTTLTGEVTMNETDSKPMRFAATAVTAPAGLYTAARGNARATWVVRPDHTMIGAIDNSAPGDHKMTDAIAARDQAFRDKVRQMRLDRQLQPAPHMTYGTWSTDMDGSMMTATRVRGDMSF